MSNIPKGIKQLSNTLWEIPVSYKAGMKVPAWIYASQKLLTEMDAAVFDQLTNVATLPGYSEYSRNVLSACQMAIHDMSFRLVVLPLWIAEVV